MAFGFTSSITCRFYTSARRNRVTSLGAFLLFLANAITCAAVSCPADVPGGSCAAAAPLAEGPSTFDPVGGVLGSAVSASPIPASSCAFASAGGAFPLAARIPRLTVVFQACKEQTANILA